MFSNSYLFALHPSRLPSHRTSKWKSLASINMSSHGMGEWGKGEGGKLMWGDKVGGADGGRNGSSIPHLPADRLARPLAFPGSRGQKWMFFILDGDSQKTSHTHAHGLTLAQWLWFMVRPQGRQTRAVGSVREASVGGVRRVKLYGGGHQATDISVERQSGKNRKRCRDLLRRGRKGKDRKGWKRDDSSVLTCRENTCGPPEAEGPFSFPPFACDFCAKCYKSSFWPRCFLMLSTER